MKNLTAKDFFVAERKSIITGFDRRVLCELYLPIVGHFAFTVYLKLLAITERPDQSIGQKISSLSSATGLTISQIEEGKAYLEGTGLVQTFYDKSRNIRIFRLFAPKTPSAFFEDDIFSKMLKDTVGESNLMRLKLEFMDSTSIDSDMIDESLSFGEVFHLDYSNWSVGEKTGEEFLGRKVNNARVEFDISAFNTFLTDKGVNPELILKDDLVWLEKCSSLYGLKEEAIASIVCQSGDILSGHLDRDEIVSSIRKVSIFSSKKKTQAISNQISRLSNSAISKKIRVLEQYAPVDYLKLIQQTSVISKSDFDLIKRLADDFGLASQVITVILDYVILKSDGVLAANYVEKVASSVLRKGLTDCVDVMNYLYESNTKGKKKTSSKISDQASIEQQNNVDQSGISKDLEAFLDD